MLVKIACIADIHFGAQTSMTDLLYKNLHKYFIDILKTKKPDIIVIAGDYFHTKLSVTSVEAQLAINFIRELKDSFPMSTILILRGTESHDMNQLNVFSSLIDDKFKVYDKFTVDIVNGMKLLLIPEEYYPSKDVYSEVLNPVEKYDWVFFHGLFSHAGSYATKVGNKFNKICFSTTDFANNVYGRVTGGHIHDPIVKDNVDYCGSFDTWIFGEKPEKGFRYYEYDTSTKQVLKNEFVKNEGNHSYVTINFKDIDCTNVDSLVKRISEESVKVDWLRIKVSRNDVISDTEIQNLVSVSMKFQNVVLLKESIGVNREKSEEEKRADIDRKNRISEYENLSFNQITKKFAKDKFDVSITDDQIAEVLF